MRLYGCAAANTGTAVRAASRRRPKAAHTEDNDVTDEVFHAPMFALNAVADWNICKPYISIYT
jgi:hypothetical protein